MRVRAFLKASRAVGVLLEQDEYIIVKLKNEIKLFDSHNESKTFTNPKILVYSIQFKIITNSKIAIKNLNQNFLVNR